MTHPPRSRGRSVRIREEGERNASEDDDAAKIAFGSTGEVTLFKDTDAEGAARLRSTSTVFFNPKQLLQRDLSVLALRAHGLGAIVRVGVNSNDGDADNTCQETLKPRA